jgi:hypothetical protein
LATVAKAVEDQLDDELAKLDKLEDDDLEKLRERRIQQLKKQATMRRQWLAQGHGDYQEIFSEKDFFAKVKTSDRVVCHFYRENWPCKVHKFFHLATLPLVLFETIVREGFKTPAYFEI